MAANVGHIHANVTNVNDSTLLFLHYSQFASQDSHNATKNEA